MYDLEAISSQLDLAHRQAVQNTGKGKIADDDTLHTSKQGHKNDLPCLERGAHNVDD